ncbi:hypothetical protein [Jhaorihella thermophila]|nr:hypothetical protein [Jhaorihella thermophila]
MERGYVTEVGPDGLIVAKPVRARSSFSLRPLVYCIAGLLLFKGLLLAQLGTSVYVERVDRLKTGTAVEQAGAWVMQVDPASKWIADRVAPYLPR